MQICLPNTVVRGYWRRKFTTKGVGKDVINLCASFLHIIGPLICISRNRGQILFFDIVHNIWNIVSNDKLRSSNPYFCHVVRNLSEVKTPPGDIVYETPTTFTIPHDGIVTVIQPNIEDTNSIDPTLLHWQSPWTQTRRLHSKSFWTPHLSSFRTDHHIPMGQLRRQEPVPFNVVANLSYYGFVQLLNKLGSWVLIGKVLFIFNLLSKSSHLKSSNCVFRIRFDY